APAGLGSSQTFLLPGTDGTNGQFLKTDGAGNLDWASIGGGGDMVSANNLSDVDDAATARNNLGLAGLATLNSVSSAEITDGTIVGSDIANNTIGNVNISSSAAIAGTKINPNFGSQNVTTTGTVTGAAFVGD